MLILGPIYRRPTEQRNRRCRFAQATTTAIGVRSGTLQAGERPRHAPRLRPVSLTTLVFLLFPFPASRLGQICCPSYGLLLAGLLYKPFRQRQWVNRLPGFYGLSSFCPELAFCNHSGSIAKFRLTCCEPRAMPAIGLLNLAVRPNNSATNLACAIESFFATHHTLLFRIMYTVSIPCNVRHVVQNDPYPFASQIRCLTVRWLCSTTLFKYLR